MGKRPVPKRAELVEVAALLEGQSDQVCDLVMAVRDVVLKNAPETTETVRPGGISYHKAYEGGFVKGGVCGIIPLEDGVRLAFVHGAFLPDPEGLLEGENKNKLHVIIQSERQARRPAIRALIRAAVQHQACEWPE